MADNSKTASSSTTDDAINSLVDEQLDEVTKDEEKEVAESDKLAESLMSLQQLIERSADHLDKLREEQKQLRESLKNVFENDPELAEAEQKATELTIAVKDRKSHLDASPEVRQLKLKLADFKEEINDLEDSLNNHLINLFQLTGSNSFDTSDGDQREFVIKARVKPKKAKKQTP